METNNSRFVRTAILLTLIAAALTVAAIWGYLTAQPELKYQQARNAAFEGRYDEMYEKLSWLEENSSEEAYQAALVAFASMADYNGDYDLALELLDDAGEAADPLRAEIVYHQALKLYEAGEYLQSAKTAASVRQYAPAQSLYEMAQTAYLISVATPTPEPTPVPTPEPTPEPTPVPTPEPVQMMQATMPPTATPSPTPTPAPDIWAEGRIASGFEHTVVLLADGTVRAFGDNGSGQCNVESWQNIVSVAAGAYHTLGLTSDGRVLSCGDNTHLQCETALYAGVQAIAANDYASFMLLSTGEVMATGYQEYAFLQEILGAKRVWAGSYGVIVEAADGVHASHPSLAVETVGETAAVSRGYVVGLDSNGTTHSTTDLVPQWNDVKRLSASENVVLSLTEDGKVLAHVFGRHSKFDLAFDQPVLAVSAGAEHCALVLGDGTTVLCYADGSKDVFSLDRF